MRNILDIYKEYKIYPFLQNHQLRAAALARAVCDVFEGELDVDSVVTAMLIHDMANIVKAGDFTAFPESVEPEGVAYWKQVQAEFMAKYGDDEEKAHDKIAKELGVSERVRYLVEAIGFANMCDTRDLPDMERKICQYADMRTAPYGVWPLEKRLAEAGKRYGHAPGRDRLVMCIHEVERQIFEHCSVRPEELTDAVIQPIMEELKGYAIVCK